MKARLLVGGVAAWCSLSLPAQQPKLTLPAEGAVFGASFEIVLALPSSTTFDPALLRPLLVERVEASVSDAASTAGTPAITHHRCRARCYVLGEVLLAGVPGAVLTVRSSLPSPPGELEWPEPWPLPHKLRLWPWLVALLAVLGGAVGFWRRGRGMPATAAPSGDAAPVASPRPTWHAASALRALALPHDAASNPAFYAQVKAIVRRHCSERLSVPAELRTSEELLCLLRVGREPCSDCLAACDAVLFGAMQPSPTQHEAVRRSALRFVEQSGADA